MTFKLGKASRLKLGGVHDDLQSIVNLAIELSSVDFSVVEGVRSQERQEELVAEGKSWTMNSRHITGHAVDIYPWVNGKTCHKRRSYKRVARAMFKAAIELNVDITWGGFWILDNDGEDSPHWQLSWDKYN